MHSLEKIGKYKIYLCEGGKKMSIKPKTTPIYQTSVFTFQNLSELDAYFEQPDKAYMYTRFGNPNSDELGDEVARLEKGAGGVVTSSGMSAILTAILGICQSGDHLLCAEEIYGGSSVLLSNELNRLGIEVTYVPVDELNDLSPYVKKNSKLLLVETMTNPFINVTDIQSVAEACQNAQLILVVDNTFATPIITKPLALGADVVIHSVTKYLSGHSDVTAGVVVAKSSDWYERLRQIAINYGLNLSPFDAWLAARGLKTLALRVKQHSENALRIARFLESHEKVKRVYYPGLLTHSSHHVAHTQSNGYYGGMLSFHMEDDKEIINRWMDALTHIPFAPSLAGVTSSLSHPLSTSHRSLNVEAQQKLGISMGLIRLSVGIEDVQLLIEDLEKSFQAIS